MDKMTTTQMLTGIRDWVLGKLSNITSLIPSQASAQNQLADKAFVNSSIATATATFRGTYNLVSDLSLTTEATRAQIAAALAAKMTALSIVPDGNDYAFVQVPTDDATPTEIERIDRYKYNSSAWGYEYSLNNSGFTAAQWAAINSGVTSGDMTKLRALPTSAELTTLLNGKQDVIQDLAAIRSGASAGATAVQPAAMSAAIVATVAESGVYDVTANNNNAKFASLSALLSSENLNTLIPSAKRKGGMSIKFVQSSDNKYVQHRFMLSTFTAAQFANVANWQSLNVDGIPIAGSDNLVNSNGVAAKINESTVDLNACLGQIGTKTKYVNLFDKSKTIDGYKLNTNGTISVNNQLCVSDFIPCKPNTPYYSNAVVGNASGGICFYSSNYEESFISHISSNGATSPENAAYLRVEFYITTNVYRGYKNNGMVIEGTSEDYPSEYVPYGVVYKLNVEGVVNKDILIKDNTYFLYVAGGRGPGGLHKVNQYVKQLSIPSLDVTKQYTFQFIKQTGKFTDLIIKESVTSTQILRVHIRKNGINELGSLGFVYVEDIDGLFAYNCNGYIDTFKVVNCANNMNAQLSCLKLKVNEDAGRENVDVMWNLPDVLTVDSTYRFWYNENTLIRDFDILFKNGHYFDVTTDCSSNNRGEGYGNVLCDGTYIKFSVYRKNYDNTSTEIASHTITLDVGTKLTNATKNVIFVGDSYTNSKWGKKGLIGYVQEFAEADGNTLVSKGTRDAYDGIKAEGYNGFSIDDFTKYVPTSQRPADWPNTHSPIKCSPFMFSDDDTVANAKFNFSKYLTDYNIGQIDCIVIFLGINGGSYNTLRNMIQGDTSFYVSSFRAALPNVKIIIVNLPAYYGFKTLSDVSKNNGNNDRIGRNNNYIKYVAGVIENVVIAPTNEMDRVYGYRISDTLQAWTQFQNDTEVDNDVEIPKNYAPRDIHPSTSGIKSIAYSVYHCLFISDN